MSVFQELWSDRDETALVKFRSAIDNNDLASALFAIEDAPADEQEAADRALGSIVNALASCGEFNDTLSVANAFAHEISGTVGLTGDLEDYFSPQNSLLSSVIARHLGQPILVSSVWLIIAERLKIPMRGIGLPGHFIVSLNDELFLDPFSGGALLSEADCKRLVRELYDGEVAWERRFLEPVSNVDICERVLRNLCNAFAEADDKIKLYRAVRFHGELRPEIPQIRMLLGRLSEEFGDFVSARAAYEHVVEQFPKHDEAAIALGRLKQLNDDPILKN